MMVMKEMRNLITLRYAKFRAENDLGVRRQLRKIEGDPTMPAGPVIHQKLEVIENGSKELVGFLVNLMKEYADKQPDIIELISENGTKAINSYWDGRIKSGIGPPVVPGLSERIPKGLKEAKLRAWSSLKQEIDIYKAEKKIESSTKLESIDRKKYDVVLSFAGEDREYAKKLATLLINDGFKVFYDQNKEHGLWGKNLSEHLPDIYSKHGKYCVMLLSKTYAEKQWPTLERRSAMERAVKEDGEYVLPIRIDDTKIPGILDTVSYQDLREKSIEEIYQVLKKKLTQS